MNWKQIELFYPYDKNSLQRQSEIQQFLLNQRVKF